MPNTQTYQAGAVTTVNVGAIEYDEKHRKEQERFDIAVGNASFLNKKEKRDWKLLGLVLDSNQFNQIQNIIRKENLRRLKVQQQLEKIKPIKN